jgi:hypothetical protein
MANMNRRKKPAHSEDEIDRMVISEAENPEAWEEPIFVPPSKSPRPAWVGQAKHLELASKFYVLSVLHRLGAEASITFAQPGNVDIIVLRKSGHALTLDVKTLAGTTEWYVDPFRARKDHFVVFVCYLRPVQDPEALPDVYIVESERLKSFLARRKEPKVSLEKLSSYLDARAAWQELTATPAA